MFRVLKKEMLLGFWRRFCRSVVFVDFFRQYYSRERSVSFVNRRERRRRSKKGSVVRRSFVRSFKTMMMTTTTLTTS